MPGVMRRPPSEEGRGFGEHRAPHDAAEKPPPVNISTTTAAHAESDHEYQYRGDDDYYYYYYDYDENGPVHHDGDHTSSQPSTAKPAASKARE